MSDRKAGAFGYLYWVAALAILVANGAGWLHMPWAAATAPFWGPSLLIPAVTAARAIAGEARHGHRA